MDRGIVLIPDVAILPSGGFTLPSGGGLDLSFLRYCMLYWDKIDLPLNNQIRLESGQSELRFLKDEGILFNSEVTIIRQRVRIPDDYGEIMLEAQLQALEQLNNSQPGQWMMAQNSDTLMMANSVAEEYNSLKMELHNVFPSPHPDTPLQEIIKFRKDKRDLLGELKEVVDGIFQEILKAGDPALVHRPVNK